MFQTVKSLLGFSANSPVIESKTISKELKDEMDRRRGQHAEEDIDIFNILLDDFKQKNYGECIKQCRKFKHYYKYQFNIQSFRVDRILLKHESLIGAAKLIQSGLKALYKANYIEAINTFKLFIKHSVSVSSFEYSAKVFTDQGIKLIKFCLVTGTIQNRQPNNKDFLIVEDIEKQAFYLAAIVLEVVLLPTYFKIPKHMGRVYKISICNDNLERFKKYFFRYQLEALKLHCFMYQKVKRQQGKLLEFDEDFEKVLTNCNYIDFKLNYFEVLDETIKAITKLADSRLESLERDETKKEKTLALQKLLAEVQPLQGYIHYAASCILFQNGELDKAEAYLESAIKQDSTLPEAWLVTGALIIYSNRLQANQLQNVVHCFEKSLKLIVMLESSLEERLEMAYHVTGLIEEIGLSVGLTIEQCRLLYDDAILQPLFLPTNLNDSKQPTAESIPITGQILDHSINQTPGAEQVRLNEELTISIAQIEQLSLQFKQLKQEVANHSLTKANVEQLSSLDHKVDQIYQAPLSELSVVGLDIRLAMVETKLIELEDLAASKKARIKAIERFKDSPNLLLYYRTVSIKLEEILISFKAIASGKIKTASGKFRFCADIVEGAEGVKFIRDIIDKHIVQGIHIPGLGIIEAIFEYRREYRAQNASALSDLSGVRKSAEKIARELTLRHEEQLQRLATGEQAEAYRKRITSEISKLEKKLFNKQVMSPVQIVARYAVAWVTELLEDAATKLSPDLPLDEQILALFYQKAPNNAFIQAWQSFSSKQLGLTSIFTKEGERWHPQEFYSLPGIRIKNGLNKGKCFTRKGLEPEIYGWRLGTIEEVGRLQLKPISKEEISSSRPIAIEVNSQFKAHISRQESNNNNSYSSSLGLQIGPATNKQMEELSKENQRSKAENERLQNVLSIQMEVFRNEIDDQIQINKKDQLNVSQSIQTKLKDQVEKSDEEIKLLKITNSELQEKLNTLEEKLNNMDEMEARLLRLEQQFTL